MHFANCKTFLKFYTTTWKVSITFHSPDSMQVTMYHQLSAPLIKASFFVVLKRTEKELCADSRLYGTFTSLPPPQRQECS